jgi:NAD(P)-dependent dehydrogenase (short-subunit alcohol dehydrogenase family)
MTPKRRYIPLHELIDLSGKRCIVTGGATGIGLGISHRLAEAGGTIVIADISESDNALACEELKEQGFTVIPVHCDVGDEKSIRDMINTAVEKMGGIDILVNNAGIYPHITLEQMTAGDFKRVLAVNLSGTFICSREAGIHMIAQKQGGCIINIASIDSLHPSSKGLSAYDASKGGVLALTRSLALELGKHDIRVNAIAPGGILTRGVMAQTSYEPTEQGRSQLRTFMSRMVLGRMGDTDDIGRVAVFLASDMAGYMTGSMIVVDGGYLIS